MAVSMTRSPLGTTGAGIRSTAVRVALVCPYSLSLPGGVQGQVLALGRALRLLGHQVRVLGPCDGPPPDVGVTPLGNCIPTAINGSMAPVAPDPSCVLRTLHALRDETFDVLHLHEPLSPGPTLTSLVMGSVPMVGTFHAAGSSAPYRWLRPLARWLALRLAVRCAVSEDARALASASIGGEYVMVNNGIEIERFAKVDPWPTEAPTVLFVSRHESRKGLEVLLDALQRLPAELRVWVASDGPETPRLRARTAGDKRVEWLGRISDEEKARRLRGADVLCAPSLYGESFGMVLLEAMAARTPIVASDLTGYRKMSDDGAAALLVPPGDAAALAAALGKVLREPSTAASLSAAGDARAHEFSMDRLAESYLELYDTASRRPRP
ncbi:MAG: glycosyltransferase family 4 protein [Acidimicrobiales bacterium]